MTIQIYYAYNESFNRYHDLPLAGKRAEAFVNDRNQYKGGHWVLHTKEQYNDWYEKKGKAIEHLGFIKKFGYLI